MIEKIIHNTSLRLLELNDEELTYTEFQSFIGLLLLFGVTKKSKIEINEIWAPESLHHEHYATAAMSRNRFKRIAACLVFDDLKTRSTRFYTYII